MIPITRPLMGEPEAEAARGVIFSGWITQGPEVAAFEREFAAVVGARNACAVSNCTTALHLALRVLGVEAGDEVVTVSHSFIASANAIRYCGATPVFVDIEPDGFNIDATQIEGVITDRTRAILCVHQLGLPCNLHAVIDVARRRGLPVVEDAACAIGSEILWRGHWEMIGKPHGDIACFSFHPRKVISTGDGGMITTENEEWDAEFRLLRQHGMSVPDAARHKTNQVIFESYPLLGYNYRMTDIQAAIGREQLKRLPEIVETRRKLARSYRSLLSDIADLELPEEPGWAHSNWQSYCVRLPPGCDQRTVMQRMLEEGVSTRRGVMCSHREAPYENVLLRQPLPRSELAQDRSIMLPLYPHMREADQAKVSEALRRACC